MAAQAKVSQYEIGKEYGTITGVKLIALMLFASAAMITVMNIASALGPQAGNASIGTRIGMSVVAALFMLGGVGLMVVHNNLPHAKYTVVATYTYGAKDGYYKADIVYKDGSTETLDVEIAPNGFWQDLGFVLKGIFTGKYNK